MDTNKLINDLSSQLDPVKTIRSPFARAGIWLAIGLLYVAILILALDLRFDIEEKLQQPLFLTEIAVAFVGAVFAGIAAAYLAVPDGYQKHYIKWLAFVPFIGLAGLIIYQHLYPTASADSPLNATLNKYQCLVDMLAFSIFPIIVIFYHIRKGATTQLSWCGAMASLSAVNFSYIALRVIEPNDVAKHLLLWHYSPMIITVLIGVLLGHRLLRW